jgi:hypothetical protein
MVRIYVIRALVEYDPLRVIADAQAQALAEREARALGLGARYTSIAGCMELEISGEADPKMQQYLRALTKHRVVGRNVDVDTDAEEAALGDAAHGHNICVAGQAA